MIAIMIIHGDRRLPDPDTLIRLCCVKPRHSRLFAHSRLSTTQLAVYNSVTISVALTRNPNAIVRVFRVFFGFSTH